MPALLSIPQRHLNTSIIMRLDRGLPIMNSYLLDCWRSQGLAVLLELELQMWTGWLLTEIRHAAQSLRHPASSRLP